MVLTVILLLAILFGIVMICILTEWFTYFFILFQIDSMKRNLLAEETATKAGKLVGGITTVCILRKMCSAYLIQYVKFSNNYVYDLVVGLFACLFICLITGYYIFFAVICCILALCWFEFWHCVHLYFTASADRRRRNDESPEIRYGNKRRRQGDEPEENRTAKSR